MYVIISSYNHHISMTHSFTYVRLQYSILTEYQQLAVHLRAGSTLPEDTMPHSVTAPNGSVSDSKKTGNADASSNSSSSSSSSSSGIQNDSRRFNIMSKGPPPVPEGEECIVRYSYLESKVPQIQTIAAISPIINYSINMNDR